MEDPTRDQPGALTSLLLRNAGFEHAFFTRQGGVSEAPWASLNFASSTGDDPAAVRENLARAARRLGVDPARVYFLSQVHGVASRELDGTEDRDAVVREEGDITLSKVAGVACGARSADCVPILAGDRKTGAVAAIHSGWRGTVLRVALEGVRRLREIAGPAAELVAAIGPHIEVCCFEVGDDVAGELAGCSPVGRAAIWEGEGKKPRVELRRVVRAQLMEAGLRPSDIDDVAGCTVCDAERFHSFRRDGARSGRMLSAIVAKGAVR